MIDELEQDMDAKSLLKHPFYQMWSEGTLPKEALIEYAKQYYHFTEHFRRFVAHHWRNRCGLLHRAPPADNRMDYRRRGYRGRGKES